MITLTKIVNHDRYSLELSLESILKEGGSIYQFLQFAEIDDIVSEIEKLYSRKPQFHVKGMLLLALAYHFYGKSYEKLLSEITLFDIEILNFLKREMPSKSLLNNFILHRIDEEKLDSIMKSLGWKLYCLSKMKKDLLIGNEDSTPVEASRYDKYADYNPHYKCKMFKAHITMLETIPLYMSFSSGLSGDNPESLKNMLTLKEMGIKFHIMNKDGAYDSYPNYASTYVLLKAKPNIKPSEKAVFNKDGSIKKIDYFLNKKKYREQGISIRDSLNRKLNFLYSQEERRKEQVGAFLRNQVIINGLDEEVFSLRKHQERIHDHIKDTVKFDVRGVNNEYKKHHIAWSFITYLMLSLTALQNELNPNSFGFIH